MRPFYYTYPVDKVRLRRVLGSAFIEINYRSYLIDCFRGWTQDRRMEYCGEKIAVFGSAIEGCRAARTS